MKVLPIPFEASGSFCYRFARYYLLQEIANEPEAVSGNPFKLSAVVSRLINEYLTDQQLEMTYISRDAGQPRQVGAELKFFSALRAKRGPESPFVWLGQQGMYRLKSDTEITLEAVEDRDDVVEDEIDSEVNGWIYAFTFPLIKKDNQPYPPSSTSNDAST